MNSSNKFYRKSYFYIVRECKNLYFKLKNFIYPHNVIKLTHLDKSWCDRDFLMFHAAFQILVDFIEQEQEFAPDKKFTVKRYTDINAMKSYIEQEYNTEEGIAQFREPLMYTDEIADAMTREKYLRAKKLLELYEWYVTEEYDHIDGEDWNEKLDKKLIELIKYRRYLWT